MRKFFFSFLLLFTFSSTAQQQIDLSRQVKGSLPVTSVPGALQFLGNFVQGTPYRKGDVVKNLTSIYVSLISNNTDPVTNTTSWGLMSGAGLVYTDRGSWSANTAYNVYDTFSYQGSTYKVVNAFTSGTVFNTTNLSVIAASATGSNGVASLPSLAQLRLATLPVISNFFDPARKITGYIIDSKTGQPFAQTGYTATGLIPANSGGNMVFNTSVPAFSVTSYSALGSSTVNQYDYTQQSGPTNGQILDATTGTYGAGTFNGYGTSPFVYLPPNTTQFTTNASIFCGFQNSGIAFYTVSKVYTGASSTCTSGGSDFHAQTVAVANCSAGCYVRWAVNFFGYDGSQFGASVGTTIPGSFVAYAAYPQTTRTNGVAEFDQNGNYIRGVDGPITAGTPINIASDIAFLSAGFSGDPSVTLEILNGSTVPQGFLPFVGNLQVTQAQTAPTLQQLWPAMAGLDWWLPLNEGSGTALHDVTGNNHLATITGTGTVATWPGVGLQLNAQTASIPNAAGRASYGFCADFPSGGAPGNYGYVYSLAAGGQNGYNLGGTYGPYFAGTAITHGPLAYYPALGRSNGGPYSIGNDGFSGKHCVSALGDGTILVDGKEVSSYIYKSASDAVGGAELTNPMLMLGGNGTQTGTPVTIYSTWGGGIGTAAAEIARQQSEIERLRQSGVSFSNTSTSQLTDNVCSVDGTSIDQGFQASNVRPITLVTFTVPCTVFDFSVSGQVPADMASGFAGRAGSVIHPYASRNIAYTGGVTNGIVSYNETPAQALADTLTWNRKAHAAGYKTIVSTMMSRCGNNQAGTATGDSLAQAYNALLKAVGDEFDWVDDLAAWPVLGATNACSSSTYFADGVHINSGGGQPLYVQNEQTAFNGVYKNPSPRVVTGNTTQLPQDSIITANCASACTVTLLDANTVSFNRAGRLLINSIGGGTVTISPVGSETINGVSAKSVAPGASIQLFPYVANPAAGGANWITF